MHLADGLRDLRLDVLCDAIVIHPRAVGGHVGNEAPVGHLVVPQRNALHLTALLFLYKLPGSCDLHEDNSITWYNVMYHMNFHTVRNLAPNLYSL